MQHDIDRRFDAHVAELSRRAAAACQAGGCDGLVVYSGRPRYAFQDDRPYRSWSTRTSSSGCR